MPLDHDHRLRIKASPAYREDMLAAARDLGLAESALDDPALVERIRDRARQRWRAESEAMARRYAAWIDENGMVNERLKRSGWPGSTST